MQQNSDSEVALATAWALLAVLVGSIAIAFVSEIDRSAKDIEDQELLGHYRDSVYRAANVRGVE